MTTRYGGFIVTLDRDIREDDIGPTLAAIRQIKGVIGVEPIETDHAAEAMAEMRAKATVRDAIFAMLETLDAAKLREVGR